jgi:eukaryotic-like serine/threonine-protein kinase
VQTLLPITEALLAAHERGIVHRDLKPDNIFLARSASGRLEPKVLDFGIARFDQNNAAPGLTSVGTVLGSPAYMSPEQARGEADVDGRTDVWALCVVLYEVITGRLPFLGDNYNALLYAILEGQPKTFNELGISEPLLWSIISRRLENDRQRENRAQSRFRWAGGPQLPARSGLVSVCAAGFFGSATAFAAINDEQPKTQNNSTGRIAHMKE